MMSFQHLSKSFNMLASQRFPDFFVNAVAAVPRTLLEAGHVLRLWSSDQCMPSAVASNPFFAAACSHRRHPTRPLFRLVSDEVSTTNSRILPHKSHNITYICQKRTKIITCEITAGERAWSALFTSCKAQWELGLALAEEGALRCKLYKMLVLEAQAI